MRRSNRCIGRKVWCKSVDKRKRKHATLGMADKVLYCKVAAFYTIVQNGRTSSIIHKALVKDMQIMETSSGPTILQRKTPFCWKWSKRFAFYSLFHMRSIRTHSGISKKKDSFTDFRTFFSIKTTENYVPFTLKFQKTTFLVWDSLCISIQKHLIVSEKLVTKDKQRVMKDKCSTCLKFHFIRKLAKKKLCPFSIENLHLTPLSKMAPEPLFACQILHNNSLTWKTIPHVKNGLVRVICLKLPYSVHARAKLKKNHAKKRHDDRLRCKQYWSRSLFRSHWIPDPNILIQCSLLVNRAMILIFTPN